MIYHTAPALDHARLTLVKYIIASPKGRRVLKSWYDSGKNGEINVPGHLVAESVYLKKPYDDTPKQFLSDCAPVADGFKKLEGAVANALLQATQVPIFKSLPAREQSQNLLEELKKFMPADRLIVNLGSYVLEETKPTGEGPLTQSYYDASAAMNTIAETARIQIKLGNETAKIGSEQDIAARTKRPDLTTTQRFTDNSSITALLHQISSLGYEIRHEQFLRLLAYDQTKPPVVRSAEPQAKIHPDILLSDLPMADTLVEATAILAKRGVKTFGQLEKSVGEFLLLKYSNAVTPNPYEFSKKIANGQVLTKGGSRIGQITEVGYDFAEMLGTDAGIYKRLKPKQPVKPKAASVIGRLPPQQKGSAQASLT